MTPETVAVIEDICRRLEKRFIDGCPREGDEEAVAKARELIARDAAKQGVASSLDPYAEASKKTECAMA